MNPLRNLSFSEETVNKCENKCIPVKTNISYINKKTKKKHFIGPRCYICFNSSVVLLSMFVFWRKNRNNFICHFIEINRNKNIK